MTDELIATAAALPSRDSEVESTDWLRPSGVDECLNEYETARPRTANALAALEDGCGGDSESRLASRAGRLGEPAA